MSLLTVDVWSDIACPWCHVGKRRLEAALARFPRRDEVEVRWRSFEVDPGAPRTTEPEVPYAERLARKYGVSVEDAASMIRAMTETAAGEGLDFRFDRIRPGNTFDAHRLVHLAHSRGLGVAMKERLLVAYLGEGEPIGDPDTLARLATEVGLDASEARDVLAGDAFAEAVRDDEREARALGISAVPFFRFGPDVGAAGAQPPDALLGALREAWSRVRRPSSPRADGAACGPDGCT